MQCVGVQNEAKLDAILRVSSASHCVFYRAADAGLAAVLLSFARPEWLRRPMKSF
jgi:hypothetical protein